MKKKWIFLIVGIIILVLAIIGFFVYSSVVELKKENELKAEMNDITSIIASNNYTEESINKRLDERVTDGNCGEVEDAAKSYLKDIIKLNLELINMANDSNMANILTAENYEEDGPEFTNTKNYINTTIEELENLKISYREYMQEDKVMSYVEGKNLDEYYIELYREIMGESSYEEIESSIDELISLLNKANNIIDFLIENKGSWEIENGTILFNTNDLLNEYNTLVNLLNA